MTQMIETPGRFAAVISYYSIIHVPVAEQPGLLARIRDWLKPGGYFMTTVGATPWTGTEENWLGVEGGLMYWSHMDRATYERWLMESGYEILWTRFVPEGQGGHTLVMAKA
jgi:hypothetical protein